MYFHVNDINLGNFKKEVVSVFKNNDPIYKYDFQINSTYYLHLFHPNGLIIKKLPFKLLSVEDNEDIIEDLFWDLFPYIDKHLKNLEEQQFPEFPSYLGIYINVLPEYKINPKELASIKDNHLNDNLVAYHNFYINNILK